MPELTEQNYAGEFIVSEAPNTRSREKLTVNLGENLKAGAVLGRIRAAVGAADGGNTGDGTLGSITVGGRVKVGVYTLICIAAAVDGGTFEVQDPDGVTLEQASVGVAYANNHLGFTISDGAADFIVGDKFTITITDGDYVEYDPTNTDGSQTPAGVLYDAVDATAADTIGVGLVRDAEVESAALQWFTGATVNQIATAEGEMAELLNIHAR